MNFANAIEQAADGEAILGVTIGRSRADDDEEVPDYTCGALYSWEEGKRILSHDWRGGYVPPIWAWTATRVIVFGEYDGTVWVDFVPRHPSPGNPDFGGTD